MTEALRAFCVCVPARNEAARLGTLLDALAAQDQPGEIPVVVAMNNTTDGSERVVTAAAARHGGRLAIRADSHAFPPDLAHAGSARGRAMDLGFDLLACDDAAVLLTTDADARPPKTWLRENLRAIEAGADIVGGALALDEREPVTSLASARRDALDRYWSDVRAIEDEIDPRPWDPAPRHGDHTGASLAVTVAAYRAAGGVPVVASREDVALVDAVLAAGGRLAHPVSVWVRVSPRLDGRAPGGMAADMHALSNPETDLAVPSLDQWRERAAWRRAIRRRPDGAAVIVALEKALPPMARDLVLDAEALA